MIKRKKNDKVNLLRYFKKMYKIVKYLLEIKKKIYN